MIGYALFVAVTATMFIRPAEIVPALLGWPIYETLILACLAASVVPVVRQFAPESLVRNRITVCVLGVWAAIVLSHLSHGFIWGARMSGFAFFKTVVYYLLLVATIQSLPRLENFLKWLFFFIFVVAALGILSARGIVEIEAITLLQEGYIDEGTGERETTPRLRSTGIFNDPNDLAMILAAGVAIGASFAMHSGILGKLLWLPPTAMLVYGIYLTQSRGGLLALLAALGTLFYFRWGWKRACMAGMLALVAIAATAKGRMTQFGDAMDTGTGMGRTQIWSESLGVFRQYPVFGIGQGLLGEEIGHVAHNSFINSYADLGFFGGTFFLGATVAAAGALGRLHRGGLTDDVPQWRRSKEILLGIVAAFTVAMLTLSRAYVATPYLALGLVTAYLGALANEEEVVPERFNSRFAKHMALASVAFVLFAYVFVRVTVRWS